MSLSPDLKQRVFGALSNVPAPTRAEVLRTRAWILGCGVAGGVAIFFLAGGLRWSSRPPSLMAITSLGTAGIGGVGMWLLFTRGRSVSGRSIACLLATAVLSSVLFVGWRYGVSALYGMIEPWPDRPGLRCLGLSLATGALPLLGALLAWRRTVPVSPVASGAAFGAGVGLGSALLVDVWCPVVSGLIPPAPAARASAADRSLGALGRDRGLAPAPDPVALTARGIGSVRGRGASRARWSSRFPASPMLRSTSG